MLANLSRKDVSAFCLPGLKGALFRSSSRVHEPLSKDQNQQAQSLEHDYEEEKATRGTSTTKQRGGRNEREERLAAEQHQRTSLR